MSVCVCLMLICLGYNPQHALRRATSRREFGQIENFILREPTSVEPNFIWIATQNAVRGARHLFRASHFRRENKRLETKNQVQSLTQKLT